MFDGPIVMLENTWKDVVSGMSCLHSRCQESPSRESEDNEPESDRHRHGPARGNKKAQVTVLNEGTIIIKRQTQARPDTSDEEDEEEAQEEIKEPEVPEPPPRDPLDVEEEALNEKLQTAGFFLSMPEEEQIKKRLLEIKQMKENPEWFSPENTKV